MRQGVFCVHPMDFDQIVFRNILCSSDGCSSDCVSVIYKTSANACIYIFMIKYNQNYNRASGYFFMIGLKPKVMIVMIVMYVG